MARLLDHRVHMEEVIEMHGVQFRLQSFVVHIGASPDSGHYVACCRSVDEQGWVIRDDTRAIPLTNSELQDGWAAGGAGKVYMLFYGREHVAGNDAGREYFERSTRTSASEGTARNVGSPIDETRLDACKQEPAPTADSPSGSRIAGSENKTPLKTPRWAKAALKAKFCSAFGSKIDRVCGDSACVGPGNCPSEIVANGKSTSAAAENTDRPLAARSSEAKIAPTLGTSATTQKRRRLTGKTSGAAGDEWHQAVMEEKKGSLALKNEGENNARGNFFDVQVNPASQDPRAKRRETGGSCRTQASVFTNTARGRVGPIDSRRRSDGFQQSNSTAQSSLCILRVLLDRSDGGNFVFSRG